MRTPRVILIGSLLVAALALITSPASAAPPAKLEVHLDFTDVRKERTGEFIKGYEYDFGDWSKHITNLPQRGCLVQAHSGKGGIGENNPMVEFAKYPSVLLYFVIGNANQSTSLNFSLTDSDGTEQSWNIPLEGLARGVSQHFPLDLTKCTTETKPGKKPGMNLKKIASWQVRGDYSDQKVEVLLVKLVSPK